MSQVTSNNFHHIKDATELEGKRVLVRCDFNVPLGADMKVDPEEAWRIEKALPTINFLRDAGARIILVSHLGRDPQASLRPVADFFNHELGIDVGFVPEVTGERVVEVNERLGHGQIIMLENLRSDPREKANDIEFAKKLADLADVYVNEAFSNAHREHASMVSLPKLLPAYVGFQFADEVAHLERVLDPEQPLLMIIGGAKFDTKLPLIDRMLGAADTIFVGGALAHTFFKYRGLEIGTSLFEDANDVKKLLDEPTIMTPRDVVVERDEEAATVSVEEVQPRDKIVDIGSQSIDALGEKIAIAQTIVWNGPLGYYEGGYESGTRELLEKIADSNAQSIIGGGDTVFVIRKNNMENDFTFVSTAGGAMLDFLTHGTLPAIEALGN